MREDDPVGEREGERKGEKGCAWSRSRTNQRAGIFYHVLPSGVSPLPRLGIISSSSHISQGKQRDQGRCTAGLESATCSPPS